MSGSRRDGELSSRLRNASQVWISSYSLAYFGRLEELLSCATKSAYMPTVDRDCP